eukprot:10191440-Alexandrium_andersonii.AAC.1
MVGSATKKGQSKGEVEHAGVGIAIASPLRPSVISFRPVSSRIACITIRTSLRKLDFVSAYAPQAMCALDEKEDFYSDLLELLWHLDSSGPTVVASDFNAAI